MIGCGSLSPRYVDFLYYSLRNSRKSRMLTSIIIFFKFNKKFQILTYVMIFFRKLEKNQMLTFIIIFQKIRENLLKNETKVNI